MQQLHAKLSQFGTRAYAFQRALLLGIQFMRRWRVPRIKRILRRIDRLLPTLQQPIAQHPIDYGTRHVRQLQQLRKRQRPSLCFQQLADALLFLSGRFRSCGRFPGDDALCFAISPDDFFSKFDQAAAMEPHRNATVDPKPVRRAEYQGRFLA